jgi:gluconolactonase
MIGSGGAISSGGATGGGGAKGGGGAAGTGGATTAWECPAASSFTGSPLPSETVVATRITDAPPSDAFNNMGNDLTIVEGPLWLGDALYVSEMTNAFTMAPSRILKIAADDTVKEFITGSGSNGLAVDGGGNIVSANHGAHGIVRFSLPGLAPTTLVSMYDGKPFNSPNDLAVARDGTIYFTDPDYQDKTMPQGTTRVYQLRAGASTATLVTDYTMEPNGVSLSLDEQTLIIGGGTGIKKYAIANGAVEMTGVPFGPPEVTSTGVNTDGMTFDCAGNLYVAVANSTNVIVVKPDGTKAGTITTPGAQAVTNAAFGGADHQMLYLTALGSKKTQGVFKTHLNFPGKPY